MKFKTLALSALALALSGKAFATVEAPLLQAFRLNPALIISMYNVAQQHQGVVTEYPADMNPAVVQVTVTNSSTQPVTPCFKIIITEATNAACADDPNTADINEATQPETIVSGGTITSRFAIQPGETRVLSAADLVSSGTFNGNVNACFQKSFESDFSDPSKMQNAVTTMMKKRFNVCLQQVICPAGGDVAGSRACDVFNLFAQQPGVTSSVPILIYPHNNGVPTNLVNFMWTPALHPSIPQNRVSYRVEVREGEPDGQLVGARQTAPGVTNYQWSPGDADLRIGTKYWWRSVAMDETGNTFGGPGGQGWNITKWFLIEALAPAIGLGELDAMVRGGITDPATKGLLEGMRPTGLQQPSSLSDPIFQRIKSGDARITGVDITRF